MQLLPGHCQRGADLAAVQCHRQLLYLYLLLLLLLLAVEVEHAVPNSKLLGLLLRHLQLLQGRREREREALAAVAFHHAAAGPVRITRTERLERFVVLDGGLRVGRRG